MVGMESFHKDRFEDRKYKYFYQNSEDWILSNCHWNVTANDYDEDVNVVLDSDKVIAGTYVCKVIIEKSRGGRFL